MTTPTPTQSCASLSSNATYKGTVFNQTHAIGSDITAQFNQANCVFSGLVTVSPPLIGSGILEGQLDGNRINFVIPGKTNDAGIDLVFDGEVTRGGLSGTYIVPIKGEKGTWALLVSPEVIPPTATSKPASTPTAAPTPAPTAAPTATPRPPPTPTPTPLTNFGPAAGNL
jgi:hypothetical protein